MRRYCLRSAAAYALIVAIFIFGVFSNKSLHLGGLLYVMLAFFVGSMAYFIYASYSEVLKRKKNCWRSRLAIFCHTFDMRDPVLYWYASQQPFFP